MTATATAASGGTATAARRSAVGTASGPVPKRLTSLRGTLRLGIKPQAEAVRHSGQVVEDPDDVAHLEKRPVVEVELAQRSPVFLRHPGRSGRELLGHSAKGT